jgi:hypothetical protein
MFYLMLPGGVNMNNELLEWIKGQLKTVKSNFNEDTWHSTQKIIENIKDCNKKTNHILADETLTAEDETTKYTDNLLIKWCYCACLLNAIMNATIVSQRFYVAMDYVRIFYHPLYAITKPSQLSKELQYALLQLTQWHDWDAFIPNCKQATEYQFEDIDTIIDTIQKLIDNALYKLMKAPQTITSHSAQACTLPATQATPDQKKPQHKPSTLPAEAAPQPIQEEDSVFVIQEMLVEPYNSANSNEGNVGRDDDYRDIDEGDSLSINSANSDEVSVDSHSAENQTNITKKVSLPIPCRAAPGRNQTNQEARAPKANIQTRHPQIKNEPEERRPFMGQATPTIGFKIEPQPSYFKPVDTTIDQANQSNVDEDGISRTSPEQGTASHSL